jgi:hypothetical protein
VTRVRDARGERAVRKRREGMPVKEWYCRACGATTDSRGVPAGWYAVRQMTGRVVNVSCGLYCSASCLVAGAQELQARDATQLPVPLADTTVRP